MIHSQSQVKDTFSYCITILNLAVRCIVELTRLRVLSATVWVQTLTGFPRRLENLENENGHGKVMEHEKIAKSHDIL